jgi:hypothetical protein
MELVKNNVSLTKTYESSLASSGGTVVKHSITLQKIKGSNPAALGPREKNIKDKKLSNQKFETKYLMGAYANHIKTFLSKLKHFCFTVKVMSYLVELGWVQSLGLSHRQLRWVC